MRGVIVGVLALALPAMLLTLAASGEEPKEKAKKKTVPAWTLTDTQGNKHKLSDYKDKIVVLEWTEPGCPYVKRHYNQRTMQNLAEKYGKRGVVWFGVCSTRKSSAESLERFRKENRVEYPILFDDTGRVGRAYGAKTTPHMFIVKNGTTLYEGAIDNDPRGRNEHPTNYVSEALNELLAEKEVSTSKTRAYG